MEGYIGEFDTEYDTSSRSKMALLFIESYGGIDGGHHKAWLLDQIARILHGTKVVVKEARWANGHSELRFHTEGGSDEYHAWVRSLRDGEEGPNTFYYETGVAP